LKESVTTWKLPDGHGDWGHADLGMCERASGTGPPLALKHSRTGGTSALKGYGNWTYRTLEFARGGTKPTEAGRPKPAVAVDRPY